MNPVALGYFGFAPLVFHGYEGRSVVFHEVGVAIDPVAFGPHGKLAEAPGLSLGAGWPMNAKMEEGPFHRELVWLELAGHIGKPGRPRAEHVLRYKAYGKVKPHG